MSVEEPPVATTPEPAPGASRRRLGRWWWVAGIAIAAVVVIVLAPLASPDPDGLNRVAADLGFIDRAANFFSGLFSGYAIPGVADPGMSRILSGLLGIVVVIGIVFLLGRLLARRRA